MKTVSQQVSEIRKILSDAESEIVETIDGRAYSRADLRVAFDRVADKGNWKYPISAVIDVQDGAELELVLRSVAFFAGCKAGAVPVAPNRYRVVAVGYYAAVGA